MEVLVTGAAGLLGRHLITALRDRGDRARALALPDEDVSWLEQNGVPVYRGDIRWKETLEAPMHGVDKVLHLAGTIGIWAPYERYHAVNVAGTENICRAALTEGVERVVHVSSWTVYGMGLPYPCAESSPLAPFPEPYAVTKAEGDRLVQRMVAEEGLRAVIVRPGTFFGPGDRLHFGRIADRLRARRAIVVGRGDNPLPLVYVTDVVQGLLLALDRKQADGQAFNITNDAPLSQEEFFGAVARAIGVRPPRIHVPYRSLYAAAWAAEHLVNSARLHRQPPLTRLGVNLFGTGNRHSIAKARTELGYCPEVPLEEGVRRSAPWYLG